MTQYMNLSTGEITFTHRTAVEWYRAGDEVEVTKVDNHGNILNALKWAHDQKEGVVCLH